MSMIGHLVRIDDATVQALRESPARIEGLLGAPSMEALLAGLETLPESLRAMVEANLPKPDPAASAEPDRLAPATEEDQLWLDKSWHALHFLFTGTAYEGEFPANFLLGGEPVGDIDVGYGPARLFEPAQVPAIHAFLDALDSEDLRQRLVPSKLAEAGVYGVSGDDSDAEAEWEYAVEHLENLRTFVREAAEQSRGLVIYLS